MRAAAIVTALLLCTPALVAAAVPAPSDAPVADAAMRGDIVTVRALLRAGADVNLAQGDGMTALHWAAMEGGAELADMLLYAGAHPEVGTRLGGYTPLHLASRVSNVSVAAVLLRGGADANAGTTAGGARALHFAAAAGSVEMIELLLAEGANVDAADAAWEQTPLMFAAAGNRVDAVVALLRGGAEIDAVAKVVDVVELEKADRDETRRRSRQRAALRALEEEDRAAEEEEAAEGEGAPESEGESSEGGGQEVAIDEEAEVAEQAAGAEEDEAAVAAPKDATEPDTEAEGDDVAASESAAEEEATEEEATGEGEAEPAAEDAEADAEGETDEPEEEKRPPTYAELVGGHGGLTALLYAAREGHAETVTALLEGGADINQVSAGDHTSPMLIATLNGHFDLAMELLERGADPSLASHAGATPLYGALNVRWAPRSAYPQQNAYKQQRTDYLELMTAVLEAGVDPNVRLDMHLWYTSFNFDHLLNSAGATPFWRAAYATDVDAMRLLIAYGADPNIPTRKLPSRGRPRPQGEDGKEEDEGDPSGLPEVPVDGPAVYPIHAASGAGYGDGFAGYAHQHAPAGWMPAVRYLVEELGADINARDHNGYNPMHHAGARGDFDMILYFAQRGGDATAISRKGQSTADMANGPVQRIQPFPRAVWLLEHLGSKNNDNCVSC